MRFSLRIFFGYFLLVSLLAAYVLSLVKEEIKPAVRQSSEEVLVDTANLLAELIQPDFVAGRLDDGRFARAMQQFSARNPQAKVWGVARDKTFFRVCDRRQMHRQARFNGVVHRPRLQPIARAARGAKFNATPSEYRLLITLLAHPGHVFSAANCSTRWAKPLRPL